jgi:hypothetical protein
MVRPAPQRQDETDEQFMSRVEELDRQWSSGEAVANFLSGPRGKEVGAVENFLNSQTGSSETTPFNYAWGGGPVFEAQVSKPPGSGFFSPDGQGRPDEVAAYYGGEKQRQKDILNKEIDAFGAQSPIRTIDTPADRPRGRGMGDRWEGPLSQDWRPRTVEVGRIASTGSTRGLLGGRREPSYRPTSANPEGQAGASASRLGGRTGGRQQFAGTRPTGTSSTFNTSSSANPNQTGPRGWWNKGRNINVPNESTASWGDLWRDNQRQAGQSNQNYQQGKKPGFFGRPDRSVLGIDIPESIRNRKFVTVPPEQGGPGSGPTPLVRQIGERILGPVATGASIFAQGQTGSNLYQAIESAADYVPGLKADPATDVGKRAEEFITKTTGDVKDWFVDKMGNVKKDVQTRQVRQAGLGTDVRGNIVSEDQRVQAVDDFIAGVEDWEPLIDQSTYETNLGVTNQPATVDLNNLSPSIPSSSSAGEYIANYVPPSQPYDQQEVPVGNYIKSEDTGEVTQLYDAPIPGVLPSQQEIAGDWKYVSTYRPSAQLQSLWRANEAATQRENREWNKGNPVVGFDLGPGMRAGQQASKAFSDLQTKETLAHQRLTPEQGGDYWAAPGESYNVPWGGFPQGTQSWVFQNNN